MEEEIKELQKLINRCEECWLKECINCEINWTQVQAIKKIVSAYKEDQRVIDDMAEYMLNEKYVSKICENISEIECINRNEDCHTCIAKYFRERK